jgi:putative transposase
MKRKRYTDEQIAFALRQAENGTLVDEVCRKLGVSEATFYRWKKQFAGMGVVEIRRLKQLEDENAKLKRLVSKNTAFELNVDKPKDSWARLAGDQVQTASVISSPTRCGPHYPRLIDKRDFTGPLKWLG